MLKLVHWVLAHYFFIQFESCDIRNVIHLYQAVMCDLMLVCPADLEYGFLYIFLKHTTLLGMMRKEFIYGLCENALINMAII